MKTLHIILLALLCSVGLFGQSPEKISYQSILRATDYSLIVNQGVGIQISVLQGSAVGTAVYVETHSVTTNANGLVSLEIGTGTVSTGTFADIDWSAGPYFLKTETDPTASGGTNYTIPGTTELLSVPYALHAKSSENGIPSGGLEGQILQIVSGVPTWVDCEGTCAECPPPAVGDCLGDGVVFYIFQQGDAGYVAGETHGLIVSLDVGSGNFGCYPTDLTGVPNVGVASTDPETVLGARIGDGPTNTDGILAECPSSYAASWCRAKGTEWFLPSRGELIELEKWHSTDPTGINTLFTDCGGTALGLGYRLWSSSELNGLYAWAIAAGNENFFHKDGWIHTVLAVRAF